MPGSHSKYKRNVRGIVEAISVLSYDLYELLKNIPQRENACRSANEGNWMV